LKKIILNFLTLNALCLKLFGQSDSLFWNSQLAEIAKPTSQYGWVIFKDEVSLNPTTIFQEHKSAFHLGNYDTMTLVEQKHFY